MAEIRAIILCGGESSRMGTPKSHLCYYGIPQYQHLIRICEQLHLNPCISCNSTQQNTFDTEVEIITDQAAYLGAGPMTGLLSVIEKYPDQACLLLGCDYPLLQASDIQILCKQFLAHQKTVCYYNELNQMEEPLLAIYHPDDFPKLKIRFKDDAFSLRHFLKESDAIRIKPKEVAILKSHDHITDFRNFIPPTNA